MLGKSPNQNQKNMFQPLLDDFINIKHELVILADRIPWKEFENEFACLYSNTGTPAKPIRMMVGLLILKQVYDLGDETLIPAWVQNPYFQYFCGEAYFQWEPPCDPSDLSYFRKRIGKTGSDKIFEISVKLHGVKAIGKRDVLVDTTAQEKNITYPTDVKLQMKIIEKCNGIAKKEGVELRQTYTRTVKKHLLKQRFAHHPKRAKEARSAQRKIKTIAGRQLRDVTRKLEQSGGLDNYREELQLYEQVLEQNKHDKNKIYSLHEPGVACIAKGKAHKKYEFGSKVSFAVVPKTNVIVGVVNFQGNPHDSKTLEPTLEYVQKITGVTYQNVIVDRGYRGKKKVGETQVISPGNGVGLTDYQKRKQRSKCRSRAAIEPIISHTKYDHRMIRNYLKGSVGDQINATMAAAAFNFKKLLNNIAKQVFCALENATKIFEVLANSRFLTVKIYVVQD